MADEIERKFLLREGWEEAIRNRESYLITQGFLSVDPVRVVRIRVNSQLDGTATGADITIKGKKRGTTGKEWPFPIPTEEALEMLELRIGLLVHKQRFLVRDDPHSMLMWEVDVFTGANQGLLMAEIEFKTEGTKIILPKWIGDEVTEDFRYSNVYLAENPYSTWKKK